SSPARPTRSRRGIASPGWGPRARRRPGRPGTRRPQTRGDEAMSAREGSLEVPTRHPIAWREPSFYDENACLDEMEQVFDICHGCRRCVSLCNAFPTLFDLVDESETMEVDGVAREDYW